MGPLPLCEAVHSQVRDYLRRLFTSARNESPLTGRTYEDSSSSSDSSQFGSVTRFGMSASSFNISCCIQIVMNIKRRSIVPSS